MLTFNGKKLPSFVKVTGRSLNTSASYSVQGADLGAVGQYFIKTKLEPREYSFDIALLPEKGRTLDEQIEELELWTIGDNYKPSKLEMADKPNRHIMANVTGATDIKDNLILGEGTLTFRALDPRWYANKETTLSLGNGKEVAYKGTKEAHPIIKVKFPVSESLTDITIENNLTPNKKFSFSPDKEISGSEIVIDSKLRSFTIRGKNGLTKMDFSSDWPTLITGNNKITVKNKGVVTPIESLSITYRETY